MDDSEKINITRPQLAEALRRWDEEAEEKGWEKRDDAERHNDSAIHLFSLLKLIGDATC